MRCHHITASEVTRPARASACLVWATITEAMLEVGATLVPLNLLAVRMPVATSSHPAENGRLIMKIDNFVAAVVAILHNSTATSRLQEGLLCNGLDSWLNGGLGQRDIKEGRGGTVSLTSIKDTRRQSRELR